MSEVYVFQSSRVTFECVAAMLANAAFETSNPAVVRRVDMLMKIILCTPLAVSAATTWSASVPKVLGASL